MRHSRSPAGVPRRMRRGRVISLLLGAAISLAQAPRVDANTIAVNSISDSSGIPSICTLRDAILAANLNSVVGGCAAGSPYPAMDTIDIFQVRQFCLLNPCVFLLSSPLPPVSEDVTIIGTGNWIPTINGQRAHRIFDLQGVTVNLSNLNLINGNATGSSTAGYGGAINTSSLGTTLTLTNVSFSGNHAQSGGGALRVLGSDVFVSNCRFTGNTTDYFGGAIDQSGGLLSVTGTTISGNSAQLGGGIGVQGGSETRLTNITVSGNSALGNGGGIYRIGASYLMTLNNVTITANTADSSGGDFGNGGGLYRGGGGVVISNSIIAGNFDTPGNAGPGTIHPDCSWPVSDTLTSFGYNLMGVGDGCKGIVDGVNGDRVGSLIAPLHPFLGALASNGGSSQTHALLPGSPAIDTGSPLVPGGGGFAPCAATDQRGIARPVGLRCDMGAYEASTDHDGDGIPNSSDNCPFFATGNLADADGDGRGDPCECTDQNGDGLNTVQDIVAINAAIFNPSLATPLCDGDADGQCNVSDIIAANVEIFSPGNTSTCARQPVPGP